MFSPLQRPTAAATNRETLPAQRRPDDAPASLMTLGASLNSRPDVVAQARLSDTLSRRAADKMPMPVQRAAAPTRNETGLPDGLKTGMENLSGMALDDVRVHYNSDQPSQLQALAYAQGSDIHVAPGQERHLPHEAWHVVQQKQGRVKPTLQLKDTPVNDDPGLESEADRMGAAALGSGEATTQLRGTETPQGDTVQRVIENDTYNTSNEDQIVASKAFFEAAEQATDAAYQYVIKTPSLGAWAGLDGYTAKWAEKWAAHLAHQAPDLMAASFGYAIESLVSDPRSPFRIQAPSGYTILPQVVSGGTRPDLVLIGKGGSTHIAWADLTAANSAGHIFDKDGWDEKIAIYAEITYPSLDLETLAFMKVSKDNTGDISEEEFQKLKEAAALEYRQRKEKWLELGQTLQISAVLSEMPEFYKTQFKDEGIRREYIKNTLAEKFRASIDEKLVPSILTALGVNPIPWGYTTGTSQSTKAGEAWLIDNMPL